MIVVTLPDGSKKDFVKEVTVLDVANSIGPGLAKATIAGKVDSQLVDASFLIKKDVSLSIVTLKDPIGVEILRHSSAHLLAHAVKSLHPSAEVTIGPVIEHGFYYDFAYDKTFTEDDLVAIEKKMTELAAKSFEIMRTTMSKNEAIELFKGMNEHYKVKIIEDIPEDEILSLYKQDDFIDLCRGPHLPNTSFIKVFKLTKVSGAYWRGDSKNAMLQRVYGVAFASKKDLAAHLTLLEEAEKRDHRKLGKQLGLFHFQEESPGMVFWHPPGWTLYKEIQNYLTDLLEAHNYEEVNTPEIVDRSLWEKSGHLEIFGKDMFVTETENRTYAIKPMSCPCHIQIFNQGLKSYRDLPIRMAEFGSCHRCEPSGSLHGLMRVRHFLQDDGHIFCTNDQIQAEVSAFIDLLYQVYKDFGFTEIILKLATRPDERVGSDEVWDQAESALNQALSDKGLDFDINEGEGAFYGPKIEFSLKDCIGRVWQCGTIQVDFSTPDRLGAKYVSESGEKVPPVMLHRAILGSFERFIGILIEHYSGSLPLWLAPIQAVVLNITDSQGDYATEVENKLRKSGLRVRSDLRNEKIGYKIREHTLRRVPYLLVVGDKEVESKTVSVRKRDGTSLGALYIDKFADELIELVHTKR